MIQRSGINRVKITCEYREDANRLINSPILISKFYKVYIPNSLKFTKCVIKDVDCSISVNDFMSRLGPDVVLRIASIRQRVTFNKHMLEPMEIKYFGTAPLPNILVSSFEFPLTPIIMKPIRCFYCQRFRHVESQCKSRYSRFIYCSDSHDSGKCKNGLRRAVCCNCQGNHPASSTSCPLYIRESEIQRIRAEFGVRYQEAEKKLNLLRNYSLNRSRSIPTNQDLISHNSEHNSTYNESDTTNEATIVATQ